MYRGKRKDSIKEASNVPDGAFSSVVMPFSEVMKEANHIWDWIPLCKIIVPIEVLSTTMAICGTKRVRLSYSHGEFGNHDAMDMDKIQ